jgi:hypothetical protein
MLSYFSRRDLQAAGAVPIAAPARAYQFDHRYGVIPHKHTAIEVRTLSLVAAAGSHKLLQLLQLGNSVPGFSMHYLFLVILLQKCSGAE